MSQEKNYQDEYFEEKFKGVESQIQGVKDYFGQKLEQIHYQTTKTNGSVAEQERRLDDLERHIDRCPINHVKDDMDTLKRETRAVRFFSQNPGIMKNAVIGSVVISLIALATTVFTILSYAT